MSAPNRTPPHNLDAEASVLGGIMLRNEVLAQLPQLEADAFYDPRHQAVFKAMRALEDKTRPIDEVTLEAELQRSGKLDAIGGLGFLADIALKVPTADNAIHYAEIVRERYAARRLMLAATEIAAKGYEDYGDIQEYLDQAEASIFEVTQRNSRSGPEPLKGLLKKVFSSLDERFKAAGGITGIPSGFVDLDERTAGLQPTELTILAARPAMGKTSFALSIARNCACSHGWPVLVFSLEMSAQQLAERLLCSEAKVDSTSLRRGQLQRQDLTNMTYAADTLSKAPILIDDTPALTLRDLRASARRFIADKELCKDKTYGLIIIDYLQLMSGMSRGGRGGSGSREQEIAEISRGLKHLSKELRCPVLALSQLNRGLESRENKRPQLADLRECVTGDTLVMLASGARVPIASLVGTTPEVLAVDERGKVTAAHSDKVWSVGRRPVYEVALASGRHIRCTDRHRLLGASGWVRVGDLAVGDRLAIARQLPAPARPASWPEDRLALLGQLIGDGSFLVGQPMRYTSNSEDNLRMVEQAAAGEFGVEVVRYSGRRDWKQLLIRGNGNRWHPSGVNAWLRELGIFGQRSHQKRLPPAVFELPNEQLAVLLRHLWATDGCIWVSRPTATGHQRGRVYYSTTSEGLAQDIAAALLRFGIVARLKHVHQGRYRASHHVDVSGLDQQRRFLDQIGAFGPRVEQAARLRGVLDRATANTNVETIAVFAYGGTSHFRFAPSRATVGDYAALLDDEKLAEAADSDLFWDRVVSIAPIGEQEVFDLTVPGPASWLADGIASHNSGAIEQDADLILFIYRDVVYNPESEHPNVAEVIIGKNRHGPTGTVETHFEGRYTRFDNLSKREAEY